MMKRKGSARWQYRERRPKHLMFPGARSHEIVSLGTADYALALTRLPGARAIIAARFRDMAFNQTSSVALAPSTVPSRPDNPRFPLLTPDDAPRLARRFFKRALQDLDVENEQGSYYSVDRAEEVTRELDDRIAELRLIDLDREHPALGAEIALLRDARLRSPYDSRASVLLREYLRRGMLQLALIRRARFSGDFSVSVNDPLFSEEARERSDAPASAVGHHEGPTIAQAAEQFLSELLMKRRADKTQDRYRHEVAHLISFFGPTTLVSCINRERCTSYRDTFALLPPNFSKLAPAGTSVVEIVARRQPHSPVLQWETHEKYLSMLRRFITWAYKQDYIAKDYADDLKPLGQKPDGSMAKLPFENEELARAFARPIYVGCRDDIQGFSRPGPNIVRRSRYWAPLIALFAGLRAGEILQLTPAHFRVSGAGTAFIVLTPDMKLKNDNAQREIPVHPTLKAIGLLEWVERRRQNPSALLFPEVPKDKYDQESPVFSKRYRSDLKHLDLGDRRDKLTFHSYRHTFKRALDRADVREEHKDELCGWSRGKKIGRRYGSGLEADVLRRYIEQISYDIDLSHLFAHSTLKD